MFKIFLVRRSDRIGHDEYDAFVVVASDEKEARKIAQERAYGVFDMVSEVSLNHKHVVLGSFNAG